MRGNLGKTKVILIQTLKDPSPSFMERGQAIPLLDSLISLTLKSEQLNISKHIYVTIFILCTVKLQFNSVSQARCYSSSYRAIRVSHKLKHKKYAKTKMEIHGPWQSGFFIYAPVNKVLLYLKL